MSHCGETHLTVLAHVSMREEARREGPVFGVRMTVDIINIPLNKKQMFEIRSFSLNNPQTSIRVVVMVMAPFFVILEAPRSNTFEGSIRI